MQPAEIPLGLHLARTARLVSRAFDHALSESGGSLPIWLVLLNLKRDPTSSQRALAESLGLREATLTHHLNAMELKGLLTRRRDERNRRVHIVSLTEQGEKLFRTLARTASTFDARLREDMSPADVITVRRTLEQLAAKTNPA